jgi:hypothetical protein
MLDDGAYIREARYRTFLDFCAEGDEHIGFAPSAASGRSRAPMASCFAARRIPASMPRRREHRERPLARQRVGETGGLDGRDLCGEPPGLGRQRDDRLVGGLGVGGMAVLGRRERREAAQRGESREGLDEHCLVPG